MALLATAQLDIKAHNGFPAAWRTYSGPELQSFGGENAYVANNGQRDVNPATNTLDSRAQYKGKLNGSQGLHLKLTSEAAATQNLATLGFFVDLSTTGIQPVLDRTAKLECTAQFDSIWSPWSPDNILAAQSDPKNYVMHYAFKSGAVVVLRDGNAEESDGDNASRASIQFYYDAQGPSTIWPRSRMNAPDPKNIGTALARTGLGMSDVMGGMEPGMAFFECRRANAPFELMLEL